MTTWNAAPQHPGQPPAGPPVGPPAGAAHRSPVAPGKPGLAKAAVATTLAAAAFSAIGAVGLMASVSDAVRAQIAQNPGLGADPIDPSQVNLESERAEGLSAIFLAMSGNTIFWALVLAGLGLLAARGGTAPRVIAVIVLFFTLTSKSVDFIVEVPTVTVIADVLTVLLAPVAAVLLIMTRRPRAAAPAPGAPVPPPGAPMMR